jgi:hypothetical protein
MNVASTTLTNEELYVQKFLFYCDNPNYYTNVILRLYPFAFDIFYLALLRSSGDCSNFVSIMVTNQL